MNNFSTSINITNKFFALFSLIAVVVIGITTYPVYSFELSIPSKFDSILLADNIIPAHPDAIGGGNPFQGLGRPDDPEPSRVEDYQKSLKQQYEKPDPSSGSTKDSSASAQTVNKNIEKTKDSIAPTTKENKTGTNKDTIEKEGEAYLDKEKGSHKVKQDEKSKAILEAQKSPHKGDSEDDKNTNHQTGLPALLSNRPQIDNSPHRKALSLIQKRKYTQAQTLLEDIKIQDKGDLKARYLLAIVHVMTGQNQNAAYEYSYVIKHSKDPHLTTLAKSGLEKIKHK